jgi:hypothetical protein
MLLVGCWLRWPRDCNRSRLTALLLERLPGVLALHWGSLARWSQRVDLAGSHQSLRRPAPIAGYIAASRTYGVNTQTALLELNLLTDLLEVEVTLRLTVSMSWYRAPLWDLRPDITSCRSVAVWNLRLPLWRENGSAICSVIIQWSESRKTRNHTLLSHLRLLQSGGPGSRVYILQEQGGPVIPSGTGFPLRRLLRLASDDLQGYGGDI